MRQLPAIDSRSWKQKRGISAPASSHACSSVKCAGNFDFLAVDEEFAEVSHYSAGLQDRLGRLRIRGILVDALLDLARK